MPLSRGIAFLTLAALSFTLVAASPPSAKLRATLGPLITTGDAYATQGINACTWTMGTAAIEKVVTFGTGSYTLTSLKNKLASPTREYVQSSTSDEFRFNWDNTMLTGASGGWTCVGGSAAQVPAGGPTAIQVDVTLSRKQIQVTKHYLVYPSEALIRESTDYLNTDSAAHTLARPSFLEQSLLGNEIGRSDLNWISGARAQAGSWTLQSEALAQPYARTFDSYDKFPSGAPCTDPGWVDMGSYTSGGAVGLPQWHDTSPVTGGFVWPGIVHPGPSSATARAWTAPQAGTVSVTSHVAKFNPQGMGVSVQITKNGAVVYGPATLGGTDTVGFDANVASLAVAAGDQLRFEISAIGSWANDATTWDPRVSYGGGLSYVASAGFSATQGANQWSYLDNRSGTWTQIGAYSPSANKGVPQWSGGGYVWPTAEHPGASNDSARVWVAPAAGTVDIAGHAAKLSTLGSTVVVRITRNNALVFGPQAIAGTDTVGVDTNAANVAVNTGDVIRFEISTGGSNWAYGATGWDPVVSYHGGASYRASQGFSSTQGANQWRYQDYLNATCGQDPFSETSGVYQPWFSIRNRDLQDGVFMGFDYYGHWQAAIGNVNGGQASFSLTIPNFNNPVAGGQTISSPQAFTGVYKGDLDDMTNRLLDWQYRYLWDYTRDPYFGAIRMLGYWYQGAVCAVAGTPDYSGTLQKVFDLIDHMRAIGADTYHRDCGWWDKAGDWNGPDWKRVNDYLAKSGMNLLVYYWAYMADSQSTIYSQHPSWFPWASPCGYTNVLTDLTPYPPGPAEQHMESLLEGNAAKWGDYQWRNDACPVPNADGATQLAQDKGFRRVQVHFLQSRPASALQGVDSGGNEISYEFLHMDSSHSFTDLSGWAEHYDASRLYPTDKLSGIPDAWNPVSCGTGAAPHNFNDLLMFNPDFTGDVSTAAEAECMRTLVDTYHYLMAQGVVGRWVRQYHPTSTDDPRDWFQRLSQDGNRGLIVFHPLSTPTGSVTVFPKALNPGTTYDVRFQFQAGSLSNTGAYFASHGITISSPQDGELIYLNLSGHPGAGNDPGPPSAPSNVTVNSATNLGYPGVEVRWTPGTDSKWVSYHEVFRNGVSVGKVSKGSYFFDHSPEASVTATYGVRAVNGDGHPSSITSTSGSTSDILTIDDASPGLVYSGSWAHQIEWPDAYRGTVSFATSCHSACQGFSSTQGANGWSYQDNVGGTWTNINTFNGRGYQGMPEWHDASGGYVWPAAEHPGPTAPTARAWTAPLTGNVNILSHASKLVQGGNGVVLQITKNGSVVWGPATIQGGDTLGVEADVSNLGVNAGDVIRFEIANNGEWSYDATWWDPDVLYSFQGSVGFSATQGANQWRYQDNRSGAWTDIATFNPSGYLGMQEWHDMSPITGGYVWPAGEHPGPSNTTSRAWTAPLTGTVRITSHAAKLVAGGNGVVVQVTRNGNVLAGPFTIQGNDTAGIDINVPSVAVSAGDVIRFEIGNNGDWNYDSTSWDPTISYQPAYAEFTFAGSQLTWYTKLGANGGMATVYIDGQPDAFVDTYAPDDNNWSVPIYTKNFSSVGTHTIRIVPNGGRNPASSGSYVHVDGLRVVTGGLTVTEDTSGVVSYGGTWSVVNDGHASNGEVHVSSAAGSTATFSFSGSQVLLTGRLGSDGGEADVYVDGAYDTRIDFYGYRGTAAWRALMWQRSFATPGPHTVQVVVSSTHNVASNGSEVYVDTFQTG